MLEGSGKTHMMRKMKEIKEDERWVVMCQIESVKKNFHKDSSKDAKLYILENAIHVVDKNK